MCLSTDGIRVASGTFRRQTALHQAGLEFYSQNSADRLINSCFSNLTSPDLLDHIVQKGPPVLRHHHHVDARVNGLHAVIRFTACHLTNTVPVADNEPIKPELIAQ